MKKVIILASLMLAGCNNLHRLTDGTGPTRYGNFEQLVLSRSHLQSVPKTDQEIFAVIKMVTDSLEADYGERQEFIKGNEDHFPPYYRGYLVSISGNTQGLCQQESLSLAETLRTFGIWTQQIHHNSNGVGDHQWLEYRNPITLEWKMVDPYSGVIYEKGLASGDHTYIPFEGRKFDVRDYLHFVWDTGTITVDGILREKEGG